MKLNTLEIKDLVHIFSIHLYSIISFQFQTLQTNEIKVWKLKQAIWKLHSPHDQNKVTKVFQGKLGIQMNL